MFMPLAFKEMVLPDSLQRPSGPLDPPLTPVVLMM